MARSLQAAGFVELQWKNRSDTLQVRSCEICPRHQHLQQELLLLFLLVLPIFGHAALRGWVPLTWSALVPL